MLAAIEAARAVRGHTSPNPWVGAVVVRDGAVVATGGTRPPGGQHAEAAALAAGPARGADLYITLEPCAPFPGKRTPPCAEAIVEAGLRRVVVALEDPDPNVRGRGIAHLRAAGVEVEVGDGGDEATALLRPYIKHRRTGRPYVIAKFAASLDGRTATRTGDSQWITGDAARDLGHRQRAWVDAVLVGSGTVIADDPALTARPGGELAPRQPARVILDGRGRTPPGARTLEGPGPRIMVTSAGAPAAWRKAVGATGTQILDCEHRDGGLDLDQLFGVLGQRGILSVWAEGGGTVLGSLFDGGHVDELWAFLAPLVIGGDRARPAVGGAGSDALSAAWRLRDPAVEMAGGDVLVRGYVGEWSP